MMLADLWFEKFRHIERKLSFIKTEIKYPGKGSRALIQQEKRKTFDLIEQVRECLDEFEAQLRELEPPEEEKEKDERCEESIRVEGGYIPQLEDWQLLRQTQGESGSTC